MGARQESRGAQGQPCPGEPRHPAAPGGPGWPGSDVTDGTEGTIPAGAGQPRCVLQQWQPGKQHGDPEACNGLCSVRGARHRREVVSSQRRPRPPSASCRCARSFCEGRGPAGLFELLSPIWPCHVAAISFPFCRGGDDVSEATEASRSQSCQPEPQVSSGPVRIGGESPPPP